MSLVYSRNHSVTLGIAGVLISIVMLLSLLHMSHKQLDIASQDKVKLDKKLISLTQQFDSIYEYKERLERSFVDLKEAKSTMKSQVDSLKSELAVLKESHKTEMLRLQEELDTCRRHEEMAASQHKAEIPLHYDGAIDAGKNSSLKVITGLSKNASQKKDPSEVVGGVKKDKVVFQNHHLTASSVSGALPSVDPNQDFVGNIFI